jgi:hypothetical protein
MGANRSCYCQLDCGPGGVVKSCLKETLNCVYTSLTCKCGVVSGELVVSCYRKKIHSVRWLQVEGRFPGEGSAYFKLTLKDRA